MNRKIAKSVLLTLFFQQKVNFDKVLFCFICVCLFFSFSLCVLMCLRGIFKPFPTSLDHHCVCVFMLVSFDVSKNVLHSMLSLFFNYICTLMTFLFILINKIMEYNFHFSTSFPSSSSFTFILILFITCNYII